MINQVTRLKACLKGHRHCLQAVRQGSGAELSFKRKKWLPKVVSLSGNAQKGEKQRETAISGRLSVRNHDM